MQTVMFGLDLTLDKGGGPQGRVKIRQGEANSTTVVARVTQDGAAVDLSGCEAYLVGVRPDKAYCQQSMAVSGNTATCLLNSSWGAAAGLVRLAYVELRTGGGSILTCGNIEIEVTPSADAALKPADPYVSRVDALVGDVTAAGKLAEDAAAKAEEKAGEADAAATLATEAGGKAEKAAERADAVASCLSVVDGMLCMTYQDGE